MARKRYGTRSAKSKGALIWTTVFAERQALATGGSLSFDIVTDSDWNAVGGQERATIMRIRGWFNVAVEPAAVLTASAAVFSYVGIMDEDETVVSASTAQKES